MFAFGGTKVVEDAFQRLRVAEQRGQANFEAISEEVRKQFHEGSIERSTTTCGEAQWTR